MRELRRRHRRRPLMVKESFTGQGHRGSQGRTKKGATFISSDWRRRMAGVQNGIFTADLKEHMLV